MQNRRGAVIFDHELNASRAGALAVSGLNTVAVHPPGGEKAGDTLTAMLEKTMPSPAFREGAAALRKAGVALEYEMHAMAVLLPRHHHARHPEWFRADETGRRNPDFNLCASNAEALAELEKGAEALARRLPSPDTHRYFFWIDDVRGKHCRCEACRPLTPSDQALVLYNHILRGVRRADPEATHCYLAYQDTIAAPAKVHPDPGIFLEYAPIDRCSGFAMDDADCAQNKEQGAHIDGLLEWFGAQGAQVLEYWLDNSRFYNWKRPYGELPFFKGVLKRDVAFYLEKGFTHLTCFACGLDDAYARQYGAPPFGEYGALLNGGSEKV